MLSPYYTHLLKSYVNHLLYMHKTKTCYLRPNKLSIWVSKVTKISRKTRAFNQQEKQLFQGCCLLLCLLQKRHNEEVVDHKIHYMMIQYYKSLNHNVMLDVLENTTEKNNIRRCPFPVVINKNNLLYVYYDCFMRIVDVYVNNDYEVDESEPRNILRLNWKGKHFFYSGITPQTKRFKIFQKKQRMFVTELRSEKEENGNCMYWSTYDMYRDVNVNMNIEHHIFTSGQTWPTIDYDCKLGECDCDNIQQCMKLAKIYAKLNY